MAVAETRAPTQKASASPLITAKGITVARGGRSLLDHVDLEVAPRQIVTVVGLNGSGKTTLLHVLLGLVMPNAGHVSRRPGLRIGYSPQHINRDPSLPLTVEGFLKLGGAASTDRIRAVLSDVGAAATLKTQVFELSGGELSRVLLARALLREPELLVLDEPMSGVDIAGQAELYHLIAGLRDRLGCGVVLVSHDLHVVMAQTDEVVCLNHHICCRGKPQAVVRDPSFIALFGSRIAADLAVYPHLHDHTHDAEGRAVPIGAESQAPHQHHEHDHEHHHG
jgi:zinc transport system ATP-binding protein